MFFKYDRRARLLQVDDQFAKLIREQRGDLYFEFTYSISQKSAIQSEALTVNVSVISRTVGRKSIFESSQPGRLDGQSIIDNALLQVSDARNAVKQQESYVVASKRSDVSSKINNEIIGSLAAKVDNRDIMQLRKSKLKLISVSDLKRDNEQKPVLNTIAYDSVSESDTLSSGSIEEDTRRLMYDLIYRQGIDPSHIGQLNHRSATSFDARGGTIRRSRATENTFDSATRLLNHYVFHPDLQRSARQSDDSDDAGMMHVLKSESTDVVDVTAKVMIPKQSRRFGAVDNSTYYIRFDLVNGRTGAIVDSVTRQLDVSRHLTLYNTPRKPPVMKVSKSEVSSRVNLEIKQIDPRAVGIQLYKKILPRAVTTIDDYQLIGTYDLHSNQQSLIIQADVPKSSPAAYRVVPLGPQATQAFEYTNVIIKPAKYQPVKAIAVTARLDDVGIRVEASKFPSSVIAIEFLVRNLSIHERENQRRNVGGILLIDDSTRKIDHLQIVDRDVYDDNVYEYIVRLIHRDGNTDLSNVEIIEFIPQTPGKVDTRITNVQVTNDPEPNVTFDIQTTIVDSNMDIVRDLVKKQGLEKYFDGDIQKERNLLKNLIAHTIQRIDMTTGVREDFGTLTTNTFNDAQLRSNQAIAPIRFGHRYRYEVTALLRSAETMFDELEKDVVDSTTRKSFKMKPSKFHHPVTLKRGTLISPIGLKTMFSKDAMTHGRVGSTQTTEISFDLEPVSITESIATRFDRGVNIVSWKLRGQIDQVDHFLVFKDVAGVRTLVGKSHSEFKHDDCQFVHELTKRDDGYFRYVIVPVMNDYRIGSHSMTNFIIVEGN